MIECEVRLRFWKQMVGWIFCVRELAHLGEDLKNKFNSESMKGGSKDNEVTQLMMTLKLKDERRNLRELRERRNKKRKELAELSRSPRKVKKILNILNGEASRSNKFIKRPTNKR